jgi:hypothetical protein
MFRDYGLKMSIRIFAAIALAVFTASCAYQLAFSIRKHPDQEGVYLLDYTSWEKMLDKYGRGAENIRNQYSQYEWKAMTPSEAKAIWQKAREEATLRYFESDGVIPAECKHGITFISSGEYEGGSGTTTFRCK